LKKLNNCLHKTASFDTVNPFVQLKTVIMPEGRPAFYVLARAYKAACLQAQPGVPPIKKTVTKTFTRFPTFSINFTLITGNPIWKKQPTY